MKSILGKRCIISHEDMPSCSRVFVLLGSCAGARLIVAEDVKEIEL